MKDWLEKNPNGLKDTFEKYFKELPADVKNVGYCSNFPFPFALTPFYVQTYKTRASAAVFDFYLVCCYIDNEK